VPLNKWWVTDEMEFALDDSGSSVVFVDEERLNRVQRAEGAAAATVVAVRTPGPLPDGVLALDEILPEQARMPAVDIEPDDDVTILYTSGTTGRPKGAVSTHRAILSSLMAFAARAAVGALREPDDGDGEGAGDDAEPTAFILCVPLFHVTGLVPIMLGGVRRRIEAGHDIQVGPRPRPRTGRTGAGHTLHRGPDDELGPARGATFAARDTSSLRSVGGGGAPMPPELVKRIDENFVRGRPGLGYGMTETNAYGPQNAGDDFLAHPTSTGRPVPVMDLRVTDLDGAELPAGGTGEIWFRGPMLIRGYRNRPDATTETIVDGWLRSGDIGRIDDEGFVYVSDRAKDMVLRGGENIYCAEVEAAIYEHPAVYEAAVYGIPDERLGEELACHVMVKPDVSLDAPELQSFLSGRLAAFKVPSMVTIVTEQLPRNASGKILKRELRDALLADG
jgi:long-chain acyl-CoA synthetase